MAIPANLKYTEDHEWISVDGNIGTIGITFHAQSELGELVYIEVETVDETLEKGAEFGTIEAVKTTAELFMPVSGKIIEFNSELEDKPELANKSPYKKGWIIKVELSDLKELESLLDNKGYEALVG